MKLLLYLFTAAFIALSCVKQEAPESSPTVLTLEPSDVKLNAFTMSGEVTNEGFNATKERGFVWSQTNTNPSVSDNKITVGYGKGQYLYTLDKLTPNTTYYYKSFATNDKGTSYGELKAVKTADYALATLTTDLPKNITYTSAELGGNVIDEGGIAVTERGICLAINNTPTVNDIKINNGKGLGSFANIVIKLEDGSNYIARSYAINGKGTSYGNEQKFSTIAFKSPTVSSDIVSNISATYVTLQGNVLDNGGVDLLEKGFCISKNPNPSISDIKVKASNNETGAFAIVVTALDPQTKYYVKAYAQNSKGLSYGNELSFATLPANIPTVGTNDFQEITQNSVRAGVEIFNNGGADITEFGICLSTNRNPSIFDRKVILGTGNSPGKMDNIGGLTANTTYYLRGYAINRVGVAYGLEKSFKTIDPIQNNLKNGLIAFYSFNGNANDMTGNFNNGTVFGATLDKDRFGNSNQAYRFNGSGDYISVNQLSNLFSNISISLWVNDIGQLVTPLSINPRYISTENCNGFALMNNIANSPKGLTFTSNRGGGTTYFSNAEIVKNSWQHVVITFNGNQCSFYINGRLIKSENSISTLVNGGKLYIAKSGCRFETIEDFFAGRLDDIGIWNRVLNENEIINLYQNNFQP